MNVKGCFVASGAKVESTALGSQWQNARYARWLVEHARSFSNNRHNIETTKTTFLIGIRTWIFHVNFREFIINLKTDIPVKRQDGGGGLFL